MSRNVEQLIKEFKKGSKIWPFASLATKNADNMRYFLTKEYNAAINDGCEGLFNQAFPNWNEYRKHEAEFMALVVTK